jgi:organic radical activating enzyme
MTDTFCILPYIHLYTEPKGEMKPCCIADGFDEPLNLRTMSIENAFNSPQMKQLRKDMEEGKRNKACDVCYKREDATGHSPRVDVFNTNDMWTKPELGEDYSAPSDFQHIDIRFSNLCNFKCRMCNHDFSSNWYEDMQKIRPDNVREKKVIKATDTIVEDLIPHLSKIKSFYFAGGEPLIMPEHYKVLNYLHKNFPKVKFYTHESPEPFMEKVDISIHYNTNLSILRFEKTNLIPIWKDFKQIFLSISCDGIGKVGEYQRTGFNTEIFEKNLKEIKKHFRPVNIQTSEGHGLKYNFQYTTTNMNAYHIFDFIEYMLENEHITESGQIDFYYAWSPNEFALSKILPSEKKKLKKFLNTNKTKYSKKTITEIDSMINFMMDSDINQDSDKRGNFYETELYIRQLDKIHGGKFEEISPIKLV